MNKNRKNADWDYVKKIHNRCVTVPHLEYKSNSNHTAATPVALKAKVRHRVAPRISRRKKKSRPKGCNRVTFGRKQQKAILYFVNVVVAVDWTFCRKCVTIYLRK